jgi:hypothetical protein
MPDKNTNDDVEDVARRGPVGLQAGAHKLPDDPTADFLSVLKYSSRRKNLFFVHDVHQFTQV